MLVEQLASLISQLSQQILAQSPVFGATMICLSLVICCKSHCYDDNPFMNQSSFSKGTEKECESLIVSYTHPIILASCQSLISATPSSTIQFLFLPVLDHLTNSRCFLRLTCNHGRLIRFLCPSISITMHNVAVGLQSNPPKIH